jgi:hypothetical protein
VLDMGTTKGATVADISTWNLSVSALFSIQTVLVFTHWYCFAICKYGDIFLTNGPHLSAVAIEKIVFNNTIGNENFCPEQTFVCFQEFNCAHQGEAGVKRHILTKTHKDKASSLRQQHTLNFVPQNDPLT